MKEKYGFVYIWCDSAKSKQNGPDKIKRYYVGCHWGTEDDGYICSSNWMRDAYRRRPDDFRRRIIKTNISKSKLLDEEYKWLSLIKSEELGKRYYNLRKIKYFAGERYHSNNPMYGRHHTQEAKDKIGKAARGRSIKESTREKLRRANLGNKNSLGRISTEETKQKLREKATGKTATKETKEKQRQRKLDNPTKYWEGKKRDKETVEKISRSNLGSTQSLETRKKISESLKGRKKSLETIEKMRIAAKKRVSLNK